MPANYTRTINWTGQNTGSGANYSWEDVNGAEAQGWITRSNTSGDVWNFNISDNTASNAVTRTATYRVKHWTYTDGQDLNTWDEFTITQYASGTVVVTTQATAATTQATGATAATTLATLATAATTQPTGATAATTLATNATEATTQATSGSGSGSGDGAATAATTKAIPEQNYLFTRCNGTLEGPAQIILPAEEWEIYYGELPGPTDTMEHRDTGGCYEFTKATPEGPDTDIREYARNLCICAGGDGGGERPE